MGGEAGESPRVVIVGGGFGGLWAAKALRKAPVRVLLVDRANHHVFQPLLYQVATAGLSPADIAQPIRSILSRQRNLEVLLASVTGVDSAGKRVLCGDRAIPYDWLILATGARHGYFGHPEWERHAPGLKTLEDAIRIRRDILLAFERAEAATSAEERSEWLSFVIVGAGATGVELAGSIAEIANRALARDFDRIDPKSARILLLDAADRVLPTFPEDLSAKTLASLKKLGVEVRTSTRVESVSERGVETTAGPIASRTVLWAAGVQAGSVAEWLGVEADAAGRVKASPDCGVPGLDGVFVIGDAMTLPGEDGGPLPGVAQVAMQQGTYVADAIAKRARGLPPRGPFRYGDKGILATIGRRMAVGQIGRWKLSGTLAWIAWLTVHIWYLIGFRNKLLVLINWAWSYVTYQRGARLITGIEGEEDA